MYKDVNAGISINASKVAHLVFTGNRAQFSGATSNGKRFTVDVTDNGPGNLDTFSITVSPGNYSASGNLMSGNITFQ